MNYGIATPAKNEESNIDHLFFAMKNQSIKPRVWVIVNDNSSDNTKELIEKNMELYKEEFKQCKIILHNNSEGSVYDLKIHYSEVVRKGFDLIEEFILDNNISLDYIGILDSDLFPNADYYERLMNYMKENNIHICSGNVQVKTGDSLKLEKVAHNWPRGGCRLYAYDCFITSGFEITRSPDTYSTLKAEMLGFSIGNCKEIFVLSLRETGSRHAYKYYGESDKYFGYPLFYALGKFGFKFLKNPSKAISYFKGYITMKDLCENESIVQYVRSHSKNKIIKKIFRR